MKAKSPFWEAVEAAKKITSRFPGEDQPEEYGLLLAKMEKLAEESKQAVVFQLVKEVLEDEATIQALFAAARNVRPDMANIAHNTATVQKLLKEGASFQDLLNTGIAVLKVSDDRPRVVYHVGLEAFQQAAAQFRDSGKERFAQILEGHLRANERRRMLAQAKKEARQENESPDETK